MAHFSQRQTENNDDVSQSEQIPLLNGEISKSRYTDDGDGWSTKTCNSVSCKSVLACNGVTTGVQSEENDGDVDRGTVTSQGQVVETCKARLTCHLTYVGYQSEHQMEAIMALITKDLSEPYSIYTYRYFIHNWPRLCFLVGELVFSLVLIVFV